MHSAVQRIRGFTTMRYINRLFTYLLTYLLTKSFATLPEQRTHVYQYAIAY